MKTRRAHGRILPGICILLLAGFTSLVSAQRGVPRPDHVIIVVEENHSFNGIIKSSGPAYMNGLARQGALFTASYAVRHPSEPNYLALFSGSTHGVDADICSGAYGTPNVASELLRVGLTFAGYSESLPYVGFTGCESGHYKRKHNPWVNFTNVPRELNQPLTMFPTNLDELPTLCFVVPNQANDMHSGSVGQADDWLRRHIDRYVQWAQTHNSLLILTWDEDDKSEDNHIPTIFVGPMVRPGKYCERVTHYNVLRTLLDMYNLTPMVHTTNADPITSCWLPGTAPSAVSLDLTLPRDGDLFLSGSNVLFTADATSSNGPVQRVEFFDGSRRLGEVTNAPFQFVWSNAPPGVHCILAKATDGLGFTKTTVSLRVRVLPPDAVPPAATILDPPPNLRTTNVVVTLRATGSDNVGVASMAYRAGTGPFQFVHGTNAFSAAIALEPGTNFIQVKSLDFYGHESAVTSVSVFYLTTSPLTLSVNGGGSVVPNLDGRSLEVGRGYAVTARPAPGNLFSNWSGGITSRSARLVFLMESNLILQANFVPNPFRPLRGAYTGLFLEATEVRHESSGYFSLALADRGAFTGAFRSAGRRFPFTGQFDLDGHSTCLVKRPGTNALTVELALDLGGASQQITGRVSATAWQAALLGDRNSFDGRTHRAPFATNYTLVAHGGTNSAERPGGASFGSASVNAAGTIRFVGTLADGSRVTQGTTVSTNGFWPFYATLYRGKGSTLGWVRYASRPADDLSGTLSWIKPMSPADPFYPGGFAFNTPLEGSIYTRPGTGRALDQTNALVTFTGGGLAESFTNLVILSANNKVTNASSNRLVVGIVPSTGLFKGTVTPPGSTAALLFQGALLQKQNSAAGFFLHSPESGAVFWQSQNP